MASSPSSVDSELWTTTQERKHPVRPQLKSETHYMRYIPALKSIITVRAIDINKDLEIFHNWHNQYRVADLWELNKPIDELRTYIENAIKDPHLEPLIVEMNGEPIGYFEIYWAAEDRIAPYYECQPYDRGFHFLIGNKKFLGLKNTDAVLRSVAHFIYLNEARTKRIVAEPRSDNKKVIKYAQVVPGWEFVKEFDFPHKRAALLMHHREPFFAEGL